VRPPMLSMKLSDGLRSGLTTKRGYQRGLTVPPTLLSIANEQSSTISQGEAQ
jgi:hypothetical protein